MERTELVQMHIDRLVNYGQDYEEAFSQLCHRFPLIVTNSHGYQQVTLPNKPNKPIKSKSDAHIPRKTKRF